MRKCAPPFQNSKKGHQTLPASPPTLRAGFCEFCRGGKSLSHSFLENSARSQLIPSCDKGYIGKSYDKKFETYLENPRVFAGFATFAKKNANNKNAKFGCARGRGRPAGRVGGAWGWPRPLRAPGFGIFLFFFLLRGFSKHAKRSKRTSQATGGVLEHSF